MLGERSRPHSEHRGLESGGQVGCIAGEPLGGQGARASRMLPHESPVNPACCLLPADLERGLYNWKWCRERGHRAIEALGWLLCGR